MSTPDGAAPTATIIPQTLMWPPLEPGEKKEQVDIVKAIRTRDMKLPQGCGLSYVDKGIRFDPVKFPDMTRRTQEELSGLIVKCAGTREGDRMIKTKEYCSKARNRVRFSCCEEDCGVTFQVNFCTKANHWFMKRNKGSFEHNCDEQRIQRKETVAMHQAARSSAKPGNKSGGRAARQDGGPGPSKSLEMLKLMNPAPLHGFSRPLVPKAGPVAPSRKRPSAPQPRLGLEHQLFAKKPKPMPRVDRGERKKGSPPKQRRNDHQPSGEEAAEVGRSAQSPGDRAIHARKMEAAALRGEQLSHTALSEMEQLARMKPPSEYSPTGRKAVAESPETPWAVQQAVNLYAEKALRKSRGPSPSLPLFPGREDSKTTIGCGDSPSAVPLPPNCDSPPTPLQSPGRRGARVISFTIGPRKPPPSESNEEATGASQKPIPVVEFTNVPHVEGPLVQPRVQPPPPVRRRAVQPPQGAIAVHPKPAAPSYRPKVVQPTPQATAVLRPQLAQPQLLQALPPGVHPLPPQAAGLPGQQVVQQPNVVQPHQLQIIHPANGGVPPQLFEQVHLSDFSSGHQPQVQLIQLAAPAPAGGSVGGGSPPRQPTVQELDRALGAAALDRPLVAAGGTAPQSDSLRSEILHHQAEILRHQAEMLEHRAQILELCPRGPGMNLG